MIDKKPITLLSDDILGISCGHISFITLKTDKIYNYCPFGDVGDTIELVELKPIPFIESKNYMAGSDGRVYTRNLRGGSSINRKTVEWYPLKGWQSKKGYWSVLLLDNGIRKSISLHRCICSAFHGLNKEKDIQVRHLDGNSLNNRPENLKWGTRYENFDDRKAHGTIRYGEKSNFSKFTDLEREHLKWAISKGLCTQRQAARTLSVEISTIHRICNFVTETTVIETQPAKQVSITIDSIDQKSNNEFLISFSTLQPF